MQLRSDPSSLGGESSALGELGVAWVLSEQRCENPLPASLIFADIEASGLRPESYPIEIGWSSVKNGRRQTRDILIRPSDEWLRRSEAWTAEAEALHGLSQAHLIAEGIDILEACRILEKAWAGNEVVFDTGCDSHDSRWLGQLYRAAGLSPGFTLCPLPASDVILTMARRRMVPDRILLELKPLAPKQIHRAAADAVYWSWWQLAIDRLTNGGARRCLDLTGSELADFIST